MNEKTAIKSARKLLGPKMAFREDPRAPSAERRAEALQNLPAMRQALEAADAACNRRREELLADPLYRELTEKRAQARALHDAERRVAFRYRLTVGTATGWSFAVKAQGDTWADVIEELEREAANK